MHLVLTAETHIHQVGPRGAHSHSSFTTSLEIPRHSVASYTGNPSRYGTVTRMDSEAAT
jgi:hypothetical protein